MSAIQEMADLLEAGEAGSQLVNFDKEAEVARAALRAIAGEVFREELIERGGQKLRVPEGWPLERAVETINKVIKDNQAEAQWRHVYRYRPADGMVATHRVLKRQFGNVTTPPGWGFFGPIPPKFDEIEVAFGVREQVPVDQIEIPHLPGVTFVMGSEMDPEVGPVFVLYASGRKKFAGEVHAIFQLVKEQLEAHSIYRGAAIDGGFGFLDLSKIDPDKVVYSEETMRQLRTSIFSRLHYPEILRSRGVDLKGATLLHGTFGTGKTLAAYLTAIEAVKAGSTFMLVRPGRDNFIEAMQAAQLYEPCVVFCEDVDRLAGSDAEADRITEMLDVFDGARAKGREVMAVLTTNYVEKIHKGMVRPGRIDAVIEIPPPDAPGIVRLLQANLPAEALDPTITKRQWSDVAKVMEGFLPAFVVEAGSRAVRYTLVRSGGDETALITAQDLKDAAVGLEAQLKLMNGAKDEPESRQLDAALQTTLEPTVRGAAYEAVISLAEGLAGDGYLSPARVEALRKES